MPPMPMLALNLQSEDTARFAPALSFGIADPLPSQRWTPPRDAGFYDLQPEEAVATLELARTESAWAPTVRLGL